MFPITLRGLNASGPTAPRTVGRAYALNTLGAIGGALAAGFWMVPTFGTQATLLTGILLNLALALLRLSQLKPIARSSHR